MAKSSFCLANVTALVISMAVILALSMQTINAQEDSLVAIPWTPDGCAQFNAAAAENAGIPIPLGSTMELLLNDDVHRVVRISEADCDACKVDNPIFMLGKSVYGVTFITLDEPGMYCLVSDYRDDCARGYKIVFQVGNGDCPKVNQG